jgi:hypothetical protein
VQDDVPPFSDEEAFAIIQDQLGRPLEAVFSSISEQPVAAASLGQVCMYCWGGGMGVAGGGGGEVGPGGRSIQQHQPAASGSNITGARVGCAVARRARRELLLTLIRCRVLNMSAISHQLTRCCVRLCEVIDAHSV